MSTKLSLNVNKIALLRNARGGNIPNLIQFAKDCARFGADGITVHPRPDERHITRKDTYDLGKIFPNENCEYNIEGYPSDDFVKMVCEIKPTQVTLVPDSPEQLTSDHGWDVINNKHLLNDVIDTFKQHDIRVSLFIDPNKKQIEQAKEVNTDRIEFYTGPYAANFQKLNNEKKELSSTVSAFKEVLPTLEKLDIGINAGHDLNLDNLNYFAKNIPNLLEVSIGQAFVKDCLYFGLENTIQLYKRQL